MYRKFVSLAAVVAMLTVVSACGGGSTTVKTATNTTTTGQQLIDLQKALDAGAITKKEYDAQKKKILNGS